MTLFFLTISMYQCHFCTTKSSALLILSLFGMIVSSNHLLLWYFFLVLGDSKGPPLVDCSVFILYFISWWLRCFFHAQLHPQVGEQMIPGFLRFPIVVHDVTIAEKEQPTAARKTLSQIQGLSEKWQLVFIHRRVRWNEQQCDYHQNVSSHI